MYDKVVILFLFLLNKRKEEKKEKEAEKKLLNPFLGPKDIYQKRLKIVLKFSLLSEELNNALPNNNYSSWDFLRSIS